jgi:hypothetical protein
MMHRSKIGCGEPGWWRALQPKIAEIAIESGQFGESTRLAAQGATRKRC